MKIIADASKPALRRTFLDRSRFVKDRERRFHCAWEALRGARAWITPAVANECLIVDATPLGEVRRSAPSSACEEEGISTLRGRGAAFVGLRSGPATRA